MSMSGGYRYTFNTRRVLLAHRTFRWIFNSQYTRIILLALKLLDVMKFVDSQSNRFFYICGSCLDTGWNLKIFFLYA